MDKTLKKCLFVCDIAFLLLVYILPYTPRFSAAYFYYHHGILKITSDIIFFANVGMMVFYEKIRNSKCNKILLLVPILTVV